MRHIASSHRSPAILDDFCRIALTDLCTRISCCLGLDSILLRSISVASVGFSDLPLLAAVAAHRRRLLRSRVVAGGPPGDSDSVMCHTPFASRVRNGALVRQTPAASCTNNLGGPKVAALVLFSSRAVAQFIRSQMHL